MQPPREIQEAHNALNAYDQLDRWDPCTCTADSDAAAFVVFMLERIQEAVNSGAVSKATPHVSSYVSPQVEALLHILDGALSREQLMTRLGLSDRKSFNQRYLQPALQQALIELTRPDKPRSRLQTYRRTHAGERLINRKP